MASKFILVLNDMRSSNIEIGTIAAIGNTRAEVQALLDRERVEPYRDERWGKTFRRGGPLEWYNNHGVIQNEPDMMKAMNGMLGFRSRPDGTDSFGHGIIEIMDADEAAEAARRDWHRRYDHLPRASDITVVVESRQLESGDSA